MRQSEIKGSLQDRLERTPSPRRDACGKCGDPDGAVPEAECVQAPILIGEPVLVLLVPAQETVFAHSFLECLSDRVTEEDEPGCALAKRVRGRPSEVQPPLRP